MTEVTAPIDTGSDGGASGGPAGEVVRAVRDAVDRAAKGPIVPQVPGEPASVIPPENSIDGQPASSSSADIAAKNLVERVGPPKEKGAIDRLATGGDDAWGAPEPATSAAEREMATQSVSPGGPPAPGEANTDKPDPTAQVDGRTLVSPSTPDAPVPATESSRAPVEDRLAEAASNKQRAAEAAEKARKEGKSSEEISRLEQEARNADEHYKTVVSERDQAIIEATISLQNEKITEMSDQLTKALESNKILLEQGAMIEELQDQVKQLADALGKVAKIAEKKASDEDKLTLKKIIELLILAFGKQIVGDFTTTVTEPIKSTGR